MRALKKCESPGEQCLIGTLNVSWRRLEPVGNVRGRENMLASNCKREWSFEWKDLRPVLSETCTAEGRNEWSRKY
jgi:hypothetical protein